MRTADLVLAVAFHSIGALSQTITHITQLSIFSDLPSCLTNAVDQVYENLRTSECPQTNPASAASCMCLKTANSVGISFSMSIIVPIWCAGLGSDAGEQENLSSGLAVFSEYCTEVLGAGVAGAGATPASKTPAETGAGRITSSGPASVATGTINGANPNDQNNSPTTSSSSSPTSSTGLSLGEKLAIAITIPATLAAIVGCYFAWRQHQRGKREAELRKAAFQQAQYTQAPPSYELVTRHGY
ncbi:hypothetical protein BKA65DRAFT_150155 [Rhexocercosporidium sp. MPI-PUGE-AT-0058]|nr:hypothetical protein BKA65DRAFT_150155 [Rhexocercosporidium sp. MPI-PUGE-AT-0058]